MKTYQDKHTFWHDKPCTNGEPSSNNRYLYSAYGKYLAPEDSPYSPMSRKGEVERCSMLPSIPVKINRLPNKLEPPMSKDEIMGLVSLKYIGANHLEKSHWNFCNYVDYKPKPLSVGQIYKALRSAWKVKLWKKHRNYFWENKMEELYCLAFRLMPWQRYYIKRFSKEKPNLWEIIAFYVNSIVVLTKGKSYSRMILLLQCEDLNHWLLRFINKDKWVEDYFSPEHPFVKGL